MLHRTLLSSLTVFALLALPLRAAEVSLTPLQDAFVRESEPTRNFGGAAELAVSGDTAVNASGQPQGRFDSILQFDAGAAVSTFNAQFGEGAWQFTGARLDFVEEGDPFEAIFNRGVGTFRVRWLSSDNWLEGSGTVDFVTDGVGNEMTWNFLQTLIGSSSISMLAFGANSGVDGPLSVTLSLMPSFLADLNAGAPVSLHVSAVTTAIGFTWYGRDYFPNPAFRVKLTLTASSDSQGDMNCDNTFNVSDVGAFVLSMTDPDAYANAFPSCNIVRADINTDGQIDGRDIQTFVDDLLP